VSQIRRLRFFGLPTLLAALLLALPARALENATAETADDRVHAVAAHIDRIYDDVEWQAGEALVDVSETMIQRGAAW
jgi:hypothetical protein